MSASHAPSINNNNILKAIFYFILAATILYIAPNIKLNTSALNTESKENFTANLSTKTLFRITKVVDGDTIDIEMLRVGSSDGGILNSSSYKVRLIGINTPESVDPRRPVECYGREASDYLKSIASDARVYVELDDSQDKFDKYGRLLAYVYLESGEMLNRKMIAGGYAYEYTYDNSYKYRDDFKGVEDFAKREGRGLWASDTCNGSK